MDFAIVGLYASFEAFDLGLGELAPPDVLKASRRIPRKVLVPDEKVPTFTQRLFKVADGFYEFLNGSLC